MDNHDFDFLFGSWKVRNHRLERRLAGCDRWLDFDSTLDARPVWSGAANFDEYVARDTPLGDIHGLTLRLFDSATGQWTIYWANRNSGTLDSPMTGCWRDGRGEFYGHEPFEGRMVFVRFIWTNESARKARWEQAFSDDGGRTWETNWIMELEAAG